MKLIKLLFAAAILAYLIVIDLVTLRYPTYEDKLFPWIIGIPCTVLMVIITYREISELRKASPEEATLPQKDGDFRAYALIIAWMAGLLAMIVAFGFLVTIPVYSFLYMQTRGLGWLKSLLSAAGLTIMVYLIFPYALKMHLYPGLIYLKYLK